MSYNWESAATEQGRKRLFEILKENNCVGLERVDFGLFDFIRRCKDGQMFCGLIDSEDNIHAHEIDEYIDRAGENLRFLDPEPPAPAVDEPMPASFNRLVDEIVDAQKRTSDMADCDRKNIDWGMLHGLWMDAVEVAWENRALKPMEGGNNK